MTAIAGVVALGSAEGGLVVAADARLDDREELALALGASAAASSDVDLVRRAYLRWGASCARRLEGDFAFVVWDPRDRRLLAARDPLGVKPLHYHHDGDHFYFATRVDDLFALGVPRTISQERVADALVPELEGIDASSTFFRDVSRLPAAHLLTIAGRAVSLERTWTPGCVRELRLRDDREYREAFLDVFRKAIAGRLRGGAAAMLSGGLDSSAVVGVARSLGPLTTISAISAQGVPCEESGHVRAVLEGGGITPLLVRRGDVARLDPAIDRFLSDGAEPFDSAMLLPVLVYAAAREAGVRAVLDGVDGDVVASLEPDHVDALLRSFRLGSVVREVRGLARFYGTAPARFAIGSARRAIVPTPLLAAARRLTRRRRHARSLQGSLIDPDFARRVQIEDRLDALAALRPAGRSLDPRACQVAELTHPYLAAALERYHRAAASQGIEARHPFLDRRVVELCVSLPWEQKVRDGWSKWIVREAMRGYLPDSVRWRRGRWVRLGPDFLADAIAARFDPLEARRADILSALAPYVDHAAWDELLARFARTRDAIDGASVFQTLHLARWLHARTATEYDAPARREVAFAPSPTIPQGSRATTVADRE